MRSSRSLARPALFLLASLALACPGRPPALVREATPSTQEVRELPAVTESRYRLGEPLEAGAVLDLDLSVGVDWQAPLVARSESYALVVVEQRSLDVRVSLLDSTGGEIASVDGPGGIGVDERLAARLEPGPVRLQISPAATGPGRGRVRLRVDALRTWQETDLERVRLSRLGQEAAHLDGSNSRADWETSFELSQQELAGWRLLDDKQSIVETLNRIVSLERALGQLERSIAHGREAVEISISRADARGEAASRYWLAQSLNRRSDVDEATIEFARGLEAAERANDLRLQGRILNWQGLLKARQGDPETARELYLKALDRRSRAHDLKGISSILNNLALIADTFGDFPQALDYYRQAIDRARQLSNPGVELSATSNLSRLLTARGQWQEVLDVLSLGLETAKASSDVRNESNLGQTLAKILVKLGEPERARALLIRALEIERTRRDGFSQVAILLSLASVDSALGQLARARAHLDEARALCRRDQLQTQETYALRALARIELRQRHPQRALEILTSVLATGSLEGRPIDRALTLRDLSEAHLQLGDAAAALLAANSAAQALGTLTVPEARFSVHYQVAKARHAQGDLSGAIEDVELALDLVESLRLSVDDPDLRATFLSRAREAYDFAVGAWIELHRDQPTAGFDRRAFSTLERARARSLVELLSRARFGAEQTLDPELLEAERTALAALAQARRRLTEGAEKEVTDRLEALENELGAARAQLARAEEEIRQAAPRYASLRYTHRYTVDDLQAALGPQVAVVEYALRSDRSVAFVVTDNSFRMIELADEATIADLASSFRRTLVEPRRRAYGQLQRTARELGGVVLDPLLDALGERNHLLIIPEGALAYIPFEALRVLASGADGGQQYVLERFITSYAPSSGVLLSLTGGRRNGVPGSGLAAFGDPLPPPRIRPGVAGNDIRTEPAWQRLPGARREIMAVAATVEEDSAATFMDALASERSLKNAKAVRDARWVHVAAHALIDEKTPGNSAIVLAADVGQKGEDGYLTVQEIFGLTLKAELVVLSGCETALGRHIRGEGLIGLTRAFLYAGAQGLQVSLWKVADDTTPPLMSSFYSYLGAGLGTADALRRAKLDSLLDPRRSHPFHWAGFVLIRGPEPTAEESAPHDLATRTGS